MAAPSVLEPRRPAVHRLRRD